MPTAAIERIVRLLLYTAFFFMNTWQDKENNNCMAIVAGDGQIPVAHCRHIEDLEHDLGHPFPICLTQTSKGELEEHHGQIVRSVS